MNLPVYEHSARLTVFGLYSSGTVHLVTTLATPPDASTNVTNNNFDFLLAMA